MNAAKLRREKLPSPDLVRMPSEVLFGGLSTRCMSFGDVTGSHKGLTCVLVTYRMGLQELRTTLWSPQKATK
jgi:hypothetical protein